MAFEALLCSNFLALTKSKEEDAGGADGAHCGSNDSERKAHYLLTHFY